MIILSTLEAFKAEAETVTLKDNPHALQAFEVVSVYFKESLTEALRELFTYKENRVCLIVPTGLDFSYQGSNFDADLIKQRADFNFTTLIADRNYGKRNKAALGDDEGTVGVIALVDALTDPEGPLVGSDLQVGHGYRLLPESGEAFTLSEDEEDEAAGRAAWAVHWKFQPTRTG